VESRDGKILYRRIRKEEKRKSVCLKLRTKGLFIWKGNSRILVGTEIVGASALGGLQRARGDTHNVRDRLRGGRRGKDGTVGDIVEITKLRKKREGR